MTTTVKTTGSGSQAVGRVVVLYDNAKAISADGMERLLSVNSPIYANDRVVTENDGKVSIVIDDATQTQIDLDGRSEILIDEDIFGGATAEDVSAAAAEIEQVQEATFFIENIVLTADSKTPDADLARADRDGDVSTSPAEKINIIFDHSDYADLNNDSSGDPLDNLIDGEDSTS